jgi:hypothetical protein
VAVGSDIGSDWTVDVGSAAGCSCSVIWICTSSCFRGLLRLGQQQQQPQAKKRRHLLSDIYYCLVRLYI